MIRYQVANLVGYENANISFQINVTNSVSNSAIDLTGYTANAAFKRHYDSANSFTLTTNGYANGLLLVSYPATTTPNLEGIYLYDVRVTETSSNITSRVQEGKLTIKRAIT